MTDLNSNEYQSANENNNNNSFILNQSNVPMDVDFDDEIITSDTKKLNGYNSPSLLENGNNDEQNKEDNLFRPGNPVLNKSFDVIPQIKDDDTSLADPISEQNGKDNNVLDTTVELPSNNDDELDEKSLQDYKPMNSPDLLPNQFSVEYPYVIPQPIENTQPSSPPPPSTPIETVTTLTKNMKLNVNKSIEGQEPSTPASTSDKTFDTNTFVLRKKERRKPTTLPTENNFNASIDETPSDLNNKQSPLNTPSTTSHAPVVLRTTTSQPPTPLQSQQQTLIDPTRIM